MKYNIIQEIINYFGKDIPRINHALKVYSYAQCIAKSENLDDTQIEIIEYTALLHDIGIPVSIEKYGICTGTHQEIEGPPIARKILEKYSIPIDIIDKVCFIISKHHTYKACNSIEFQIIIEADFIVNAFEENITQNAISHMYNDWFKTGEGKIILRNLFL